MSRMVRRLVLAAAIVGGTLSAGAATTTPAQAYCDPGPTTTTSSCSNSCTRSAEAWEKLTKTEAPWLCPM